MDCITLKWRIIFPVYLLLLLAVGFTDRANAEIYKYQKDGVWYYTDTPPENLPESSQTMSESGKRAPTPTAAGTPVLSAYPVRNDIERAAAATVTVKSSMSLGSGFFISTAGHIITNKHVVRQTANQSRRQEAHIENIENRFEFQDDRLSDENKKLQDYKSRLERQKKVIENETDKNRRKYLQNDYDSHLKQYNNWRSDFEKRRQAYNARKKQFESQLSDYNYSKSIANLSQVFNIILADNTELYARLVATSDNYDLALLKLDGYKTPVLTPGASSQLAQSDPVYAIGSPAAQRNSVTSGVFSGMQNGFLQTNAQIYPGNSGGPLVADDGSVLGVNTFKKLTHKFEGLGFAIPIETVIREFKAQLPAGI
jgi:S1-C subfamily serine protease